MSDFRLTCSDVNELVPAYALGAIDPDEERAISEHLMTCDDAHLEARELIAAAAIVPASLAPVAPSAALRTRLMTTIAETPQAHRRAALEEPRPIGTRAPWWRINALPAGLAAAALAAAVGFGAWGISARNELAERDAALQAIASADAIFAASGEAGSGWLVESGDAAMFMADGLASPPSGQLYELWLIHADGTVLAVGTIDDTEGWSLVTLESGLEGAVTFAVTAEEERVEAPTSDPVLIASIDT